MNFGSRSSNATGPRRSATAGPAAPASLPIPGEAGCGTVDEAERERAREEIEAALDEAAASLADDDLHLVACVASRLAERA